MHTEPRRLHFEEFARSPASVFEALVRENEVVLVERAGVVYRLEVDKLRESQDVWVDYNPQQAREALRKSRGALIDVDRQQLIADLHRARRQKRGSRPA